MGPSTSWRLAPCRSDVSYSVGYRKCAGRSSALDAQSARASRPSHVPKAPARAPQHHGSRTAPEEVSHIVGGPSAGGADAAARRTGAAGAASAGVKKIARRSIGGGGGSLLAARRSPPPARPWKKGWGEERGSVLAVRCAAHAALLGSLFLSIFRGGAKCSAPSACVRRTLLSARSLAWQAARFPAAVESLRSKIVLCTYSAYNSFKSKIVKVGAAARAMDQLMPMMRLHGPSCLLSGARVYLRSPVLRDARGCGRQRLPGVCHLVAEGALHHAGSGARQRVAEGAAMVRRGGVQQVRRLRTLTRAIGHNHAVGAVLAALADAGRAALFALSVKALHKDEHVVAAAAAAAVAAAGLGAVALGVASAAKHRELLRDSTREEESLESVSEVLVAAKTPVVLQGRSS